MSEIVTENPYKFLTGHFFKATLKGQIHSLWKTKDNTERIAEYKKALEAGHCKLGPVTKRQADRMASFGITIPTEYLPVKKARKPREVRLTARQVERLASFGITCPEEMRPLVKKEKATTNVSTPTPEQVPVVAAPVNPVRIMTHETPTNPSLIPPTGKVVFG